MIIPIETNSGGYNIVLERGSINRAEEYVDLKRKVLIVTDTGVPENYSNIIADKCLEPIVVTIPQGETSKNFDNFKMLLSKLVENEFTRTDCIVAVGGGVVGDLSGFVASSYMRGIDFYNIPTTVLSQVDSSIGGKVAIDFEGYKNIVGAFYPPKAVIIDPDTLKTLPLRQISNGLAEALKMAITFDADLFKIFQKDDYLDYMDTIIEKSLLIKKSVVEEDEKESGLRKVLNFGHTLAHAIESNNEMQNLYHGECVAIGMLPMCSDDVRRKISPILKKLNLTIDIDLNSERIIEAIKHDKKISGEKITIIFSSKIGNFEMKEINLNELDSLLKGVIQ